MKITIKWWNWKTGREEKVIHLPKTQNGYISKRAWAEFEAALKALEGKRVRLEINKRTWA